MTRRRTVTHWHCPMPDCTNKASLSTIRPPIPPACSCHGRLKDMHQTEEATR